jgi:hypothetical protein
MLTSGTLGFILGLYTDRIHYGILEATSLVRILSDVFDAIENRNASEMKNDRRSPGFDLCAGQGGIVELYNKAR